MKNLFENERKNMAFKMLIISPFIPYDNVGHAGGKIHNYYLKKFHQSEEFEVKLITFSSSDDLKKHDLDRYGIDYRVIVFSRTFIARAIRFIWRKISALNVFDKRGAFVASCFKKAIIKALKDLKNNDYQPDIILMEWTQVVLLISEIKKIYPNNYYIAFEYDVLFLPLERKIKFYKGIKKFIKKMHLRNEKKYELYSLRLSNLIITLNIKDKNLLINEGINPEKVYCVSPYYMNLFNVIPDYTSKNLIFFGAMGRVENYISVIWFIKNVYREVIKRYPKTIFYIVGSNPPGSLLKYKSDNIIITGFVNHPENYFKNSCCMICPLLLGGGIKIKVLEGMSAGLPVITNNIGIEGIPAKEELEYLHAETDEEYLRNIIKIFKNPELAKKIGEAGRNFVKENFDLKTSFNRYKERILEDIIKR